MAFEVLNAIFTDPNGFSFPIPMIDLGDQIPPDNEESGLGYNSQNWQRRSAIAWSDVYDGDLPDDKQIWNVLTADTVYSVVDDRGHNWGGFFIRSADDYIELTSHSDYFYPGSAFTPHILADCWLVTFKINNARSMGFLLRGDGWYYSPDYSDCASLMYQNGTNDMFNVMWNHLTISESPGEKGFKPIKDLTQHTKGGGEVSGKTPGYKTEDLSQPTAPNESVASAVGSGFINCYKIDSANLNKVGQCLFSPNLTQMLNGLFMNPMDSLISLNVFPCTPDVGASDAVNVFGYWCKAEALGYDANGYRLNKQFKVFHFGTLHVPEEWESFLDYDATSVTLFLPFIGEVDLPSTEIIGSNVTLDYTVDFFTGMCVANVLVKKGLEMSSGGLVSHCSQHSYQGNCAVNLPLTAVNYGAMIGSFINAASTGLRTGLAGAAASLASDVASGGFRPTITTKGTLSANAGMCGVLYPYITVTRPITAECESYQEVVGYPSYIKNTIGACEGLCVCEEIDLKGINGATESEIARIRQLCLEGVRN